jgi:hypothetical protein
MGRMLALLLVVPLLPVAASPASADCTCRFQGRNYDLGQNVCMQTARGARIATCGMVLNNTSWQFSETPCVVSTAPPPASPANAVAHDHKHHRHGG